MKDGFDRPKTNAAAPQPCIKTKQDLAVELSVLGHALDPDKFKLDELQEMVPARAIPLQKIVPSASNQTGSGSSREGCIRCHRSKGRFVCSFWVSMHGKMRCFTESCLGFANEATQWHAMGEQMGVRAIVTTKFHTEMAGEGTECLWAVTKSWCHSKPLEAKCKKASFL